MSFLSVKYENHFGSFSNIGKAASLHMRIIIIQPRFTRKMYRYKLIIEHLGEPKWFIYRNVQGKNYSYTESKYRYYPGIKEG